MVEFNTLNNLMFMGLETEFIYKLFFFEFTVVKYNKWVNNC